MSRAFLVPSVASGGSAEVIDDATDGLMEATELFYSGGTIYITHEAGLITAYFHLSEVLVAAGDTAEPGALIGRVGATGRVTGLHLHWLVRGGRRPLDGTTLLDRPVPSREPADAP